MTDTNIVPPTSESATHSITNGIVTYLVQLSEDDPDANLQEPTEYLLGCGMNENLLLQGVWTLISQTDRSFQQTIRIIDNRLTLNPVDPTERQCWYHVVSK